VEHIEAKQQVSQCWHLEALTKARDEPSLNVERANLGKINDGAARTEAPDLRPSSTQPDRQLVAEDLEIANVGKDDRIT
jgi:hypothetical protein